MESMLLDLNRIALDERCQTRVALDEMVVEEYANAINDGARFPAGIVYFDGSSRWLASGFHRYHAHKLAGRAAMSVEVRKGTVRDAILCAIGENQTHGIRRSNADKNRTVMVLLDDSVWKDWADREIAHKAGVSHTFVATLRNPEKAAAKKSKGGIVATPTDPKPTSKAGITLENPPKVATVANCAQVIHRHDEPADDSGDDPVAILSAEVTRLTDRLAVAAMGDATEDEKTMAMEGLNELRSAYSALKAERDSIAHQRDALMRENNELKGEVRRMRNKIDSLSRKAA